MMVLKYIHGKFYRKTFVIVYRKEYIKKQVFLNERLASKCAVAFISGVVSASPSSLGAESAD